MKRAIIIHGWGGNPHDHWKPWLKQQLESQVFLVEMPAMPNTNEPVIADWVGKLQEVVGEPDEELVLVGHSMGCQTILRYLATLPDTAKVAGAVMVGGFFQLSPFTYEAQEAIAKPWVVEPINIAKVRTVCPRIVAFFSTDDKWVPLAPNKKRFQDELGAEVFVEHQQGHFCEEDGVTEVPRVLDAVLSFYK